jgi:endo-alpha-1,4-polygalactosaminidase (GH114 family)
MSKEIVQKLEFDGVYFDVVQTVFGDQSEDARYKNQIELTKESFRYDLSTLVMRTLHSYQIIDKHKLVVAQDSPRDKEDYLPGITNEASKLATTLLSDLKMRLTPSEDNPDIPSRRRRRR